MRFEANDTVTYPSEAILETMIERMEDIVPFLDNIEAIEMIERQDLSKGQIQILRRWQGSATSIPAVIRPFVSAELMAWIDTAIWTPAKYCVEWSQSSCNKGAAQLYTCSGVNYFEPAPGNPKHTQIRVTGELIIHPDRVPGVPRILATRIAPQVESFIVGLITPNLTGLARGLQRYFSAGKGANKKTPRKSRSA